MLYKRWTFQIDNLKNYRTISHSELESGCTFAEAQVLQMKNYVISEISETTKTHYKCNKGFKMSKSAVLGQCLLTAETNLARQKLVSEIFSRSYGLRPRRRVNIIDKSTDFF